MRRFQILDDRTSKGRLINYGRYLQSMYWTPYRIRVFAKCLQGFRWIPSAFKHVVCWGRACPDMIWRGGLEGSAKPAARGVPYARVLSFMFSD